MSPYKGIFGSVFIGMKAYLALYFILSETYLVYYLSCVRHALFGILEVSLV